MKKFLTLTLALACSLATAWANVLAEADETEVKPDFAKAVYIRDARLDSHEGGIHYWCNSDDAYLGYMFNGDNLDECRWQLVPEGNDADGNERYRVLHIASGLYVEGLRYITDGDDGESDVLSPLTDSYEKAHPLTFIKLDNGHYYICDTYQDEAHGYHGGTGLYNYAMCGNYGNVGGYWREYDFGEDSYGQVVFACEWEVAPAPKSDALDTAPIPDGEEIYIALTPNWSNYGEYLWTSDGSTAGLVHIDRNNPNALDFSAAAFLRVPTDEPGFYKLYHIKSQRYLYGLNYIADSPDADPTNIYDGDPWDNRCVLTSDAEKAHALHFIDDFVYARRSGSVYDYKARGWTAIQDPVVEAPGDGCHYYGGNFGYCVYSLYKNTNYELGGFGAAFCGDTYEYYSPDPWKVRTPKEFATHLGIGNIDSQIPVGINTVIAPCPASGSYDLSGRPTSNSHHGITITADRKSLR